MMKKFRIKADEMEMAINFKSMRLSWTFLLVTLLIWAFLEIAKGNTATPLLPLIALQGVVFWLSKLIYTKKMTAGNDDDEKPD